MKLLFENWRKFLTEQNEPKVVTFDFDDTLAKSDFNNETGAWKYMGPHEPMMKRIKYFINEPGTKVYVVTSRRSDLEAASLNNEDQRSVQEFLDEHGLKVDGVFFTDGESKIETLLSKWSIMHHDDDPGDILDARTNNIEAIISDPYKNYEGLLASELQQREQEPEEELEEVGMIPVTSLNMQPNGKQVNAESEEDY